LKLVNISPPNGFDVVIQGTSLATSEWYKDIIFYLKSGQFPPEMSSKERRTLKMKTNQYVLVSGVLFQRNFDGILLRCLDYPKSREILQEFHSGVCGGHFSSVVTNSHNHSGGYYWPTIFKYAYEMIQNVFHVKHFQEK
jgi:hypothetical protein